MDSETDGSSTNDILREAIPAGGNLVDPASLAWHMWGGVGWHFSAGAFVHPFLPHPHGSANYMVLIRLRRNDENPYYQPVGLQESDFIGDSELEMPAIRNFMHPGGDKQIPTMIGEIVPNQLGRVGALRMVAVGALRMLDAYRMAQTALNLFAVDVAVRYGIPLRRSAMLIARIDAHPPEFAAVTPIGYPNVVGIVSLDRPKPIARLYANYAEALASNSPFYAFLCLFSLVEFLTQSLQGRLRKLSRLVPIEFENLSGRLTQDDVRNIGKFAVGMTFEDLLREARPQRNAAAHFLIEISSRPFNVVSEDHIAFLRDLFKIASRRLMEIAENNVNRFLAAGVSERTLTTAFEGRFDQLSELANVLWQRLGTLP